MKKTVTFILTLVLSLNIMAMTVQAADCDDAILPPAVAMERPVILGAATVYLPDGTEDVFCPEHIREVLAELQGEYPDGTSWWNGFDNYYALGDQSYVINRIADQYLTFNPDYLPGSTVPNDYGWVPYGRLSTLAGCGGFAGMVSDRLFGFNTGDVRPASLEDVQPGDFVVMKDDAGHLRHIAIATTGLQEYQLDYETAAHYIGIADAGGPQGVQWNQGLKNVVFTDIDGYYDGCGDWTQFDIWTRRPVA